MSMKRATSNFRDENINPCFEEGKLTTKCLKENFYVSNKCTIYFQNYQNCLRFWNKVKRLRNKNNITPSLPDKEERDRIKKKIEEGVYVYQCS